MPSSTRPYCQQCQRPERACICHLVLVIDHQTPLTIIQHSDEQNQAKGTAKLASLCLKKLHLSILDPDKTRLTVPKGVAILFPLPNAIELTKTAYQDAQVSEVWLIDGTWRQANRILAALDFEDENNTPFFILPESDSVLSQYSRLRKTKRKNAFSTLEAAQQALIILEPNNRALAQLSDVFEGFIDFQNHFFKRI